MQDRRNIIRKPAGHSPSAEQDRDQAVRALAGSLAASALLRQPAQRGNDSYRTGVCD